MTVKSIWQTLFSTKTKPVIIGMIHAKPFPGTPKFRNTSYEEIVESACEEADIYKKAGLDGILIENMHDLPYEVADNVGPEIVAGMSRVANEVKKIAGNIKCGVQILAAANKQALAVAQASSCDFIRVEGFVFSHIADEGPIHSCAAPLLRYRKSIEANNIAILTDIKKKHSSHSITADVDVTETAKAAEFFLSDGIILTGSATGNAPQSQLVKDVQKVVSIPVIVGSGVTIENVDNFMNCDGLIIGSYFKKSRRWDMDLDIKNVNAFMTEIMRRRK